MKKGPTFILLICILIATVSFAAGGRPIAQITVRVQDDCGVVVTGIVVGASTFWRHVPGEGFGRDEHKTVTGTTDTNGLVTLSIPSLTGEIAYGARPFDGFYENESARITFTNAVVGKWQPWNQTVELQLKKIREPIAMYAKQYGEGKPVKIPEIGKPVGFDLLKGDWVDPYGNGKDADLIFKLDAKLGGMTKNGYQIHDSVFTVGFSNEGDGIQSVYAQPAMGSALRLSRYAPEQGYATNLVRRAYSHEDGRYIERREDQNYFFRVRTKKDDKGNIVNAVYGKIHGEIGWDWRGDIRFTYYLNPTPNDRNMEFDPKQNLFPDLKSTEQVTDP